MSSEVEAMNVESTGATPDIGAADPRLHSCLRQVANGVIKSAELITVLRSCRLLLPLVAIDPNTELENPVLHSSDGRTALLAFSSLELLIKWQTDARPLPMTANDLARECVNQKIDGLLIDYGSEHSYVVSDIELIALAA